MSILTDPHRGQKLEISEHEIQADLAVTRKKTKLKYSTIKNQEGRRLPDNSTRKKTRHSES